MAPHPTDDFIPDESPPRDACGVFGVWAPGEEVAKLTYFGLYALQHRGQEAAGMAVSDGSAVVVYKDLGLVAQVFDEPILGALSGHLAIGHTRYSTTGSCTWENAQPSYRSSRHGGGIALGHNGNLTNTADLAAALAEPAAVAGHARLRGCRRSTSDSDLITALLAGHPDLSLEAAAMQVLPTLRGAFSLVFMDENTIYAARDPYGVRPLVLGRLERGWVVASETAALDIVGAVVRPRGRAGRADRDRRARSALAAVRRGDPEGLPVRVRLPRPPRHLDRRPFRAGDPGRGRPAAGARAPRRRRPGDPGARERDAGSGRLRRGRAASRTASAWSRTPMSAGPSSSRPAPSASSASASSSTRCATAIAGKRLVVVDDTIVRGNTQRALVRMLREAGAARGPRPDLVAAGAVAVLLRHRLRLPRRADRQRADRRAGLCLDRCRLPGLHLAGRAGLRDHAARERLCQRVLHR